MEKRRFMIRSLILLSICTQRRICWRGGRSARDAGTVTGPGASVVESAEIKLFPFVQGLRREGGCCAELSRRVRVIVGTPSSGADSPSFAALASAATRAESAFRGFAAASGTRSSAAERANPSRWQVDRVRVQLGAAAGESLGLNSDYGYTITCVASDLECVVSADGPYGAIVALQSTLVQLFAGTGRSPFQSLHISDWPDFKVRALMVDMGRRFIPKETLLRQVVDGMALVRMNVLHLHLNDFCRFALALPGFPELSQGGLLDGQYSVDDIRDVVRYASARGIRVVPEVDLPGHASALLPLKGRGLHFCEPTEGEMTLPEEAAKIYDDPAGESRDTIKRMLEELVAAFDDRQESWLHVGGDEVKPGGLCTRANVVGLENYISQELATKHLKHVAVAWGDVMGDADLVLTTWRDPGDVKKFLQRGKRVVAATVEHHYLDFSASERPAASFWYDPVATYGAQGKFRDNLLGGMSAMWTDRYCYKYQCGAAGERIAKEVSSHGIPVASSLFDRGSDDTFALSFGGMVWPRAAVTAASLWNYKAGVSQEELHVRVAWVSKLLRDVGGVASCPSGCHCDELSACGKRYDRL
mmetsp:Transcript_50737/g.142042  ORF Transcript_50737/g.142042 Transcript_50737/m.142042 type:complete len:587 (+) Transcript_50737:48-1808(+)